jgi:plastocyanin
MRRGRLGAVVRAGLPALGAGLLLLLPGCTVNRGNEDLVTGKQTFVAKCGACHTLARAGTTGVVGPNLDVAFRRSRIDGLHESTFAGVVRGWVLHPNQNPQINPETRKPMPLMPAEIVTGRVADDVAAYVGYAAAKPGKDSGRLGTVGVKKSNEVAKEKDGTLAIPADPSGALAYQFGSAEAQPGTVKVTSKNDASIDHDIAVEGNGVNDKGDVVNNGGTSEVDVDLKAGDYTFYCSVPGHREGGMEGKLTVK